MKFPVALPPWTPILILNIGRFLHIVAVCRPVMHDSGHVLIPVPIPIPAFLRSLIPVPIPIPAKIP